MKFDVQNSAIGSPLFDVREKCWYFYRRVTPLLEVPLRNYVRGGGQEWSGGAPERVGAPVPRSRADVLER